MSKGRESNPLPIMTVVVALLLLLSAYSEASPKRAPLSMQETLKLMKAERYHEAIEALESQARLQPGSPAVLLNLGWAYRRISAPEQARRCWDLLVKLDPSNPLYLRLLADVELELGNTRLALSLVQKALRIAPGDRDASMVSAKALHQAGREREALESMKSVLTPEPKDALTWQKIARLYTSMGKLNKALNAAEKALKLEPASPEALYLKADLLETRQDWRGAQALYEQVLERNPKSFRALFALARVAEAQRDYERALSIVRQLRRQSSPGSMNALLSVQEARLLADSGRMEQAFRVLRKAAYKPPAQSEISLSDPWVKVRMMEASLWIRQGRMQRALRIYSDLGKRGLKEPELIAQHGLAMERAGKDYEARRLYAKASQLEPDNDRFRRLLTRSQKKVGPALDSEVRSFADNFDRASSKILMRLGTSIKATRFTTWIGRGLYTQPGIPRLSVQETGMLVDLVPDIKTELSLSYSRLFPDAPARHADNLALRWSNTSLPDLRLSAGLWNTSVETAAALQARRRQRSYGLEMDWSPRVDWSTSLAFRLARYNDSNSQKDVRFEISRRTPLPSLSAGYAFAHIASQRSVMAEYYSPLRLNQHVAFLALSHPFGERERLSDLRQGELRVQYGLGYGLEEGRQRNVHSLRGSLIWRLADYLSLQTGLQYSRSPRYVSRGFSAGIGLSF